MLRATAFAIALLWATPTHAGDFNPTRDDVRAYVAEHGRAKALAFAAKNKATWKQYREAYKCLRK